MIENVINNARYTVKRGCTSMTTKNEHKKNLENGIITEEMLELVLYSLNKRAKNCRDQKNKYYKKGKNSRYKNDYSFKTVEQYKQKEYEYYEQKDFLLTSLLKPSCIHKKVSIREVKRRIYSYEDEYWEYEDSPKVVYSHYYYDRELDELIDFVDIIESKTIENYFLYYQTKNYSFHTPINDPSEYPDLEIVELESLETFGKDIQELASIQFCKKLIELVKSGNYKYIQN